MSLEEYFREMEENKKKASRTIYRASIDNTNNDTKKYFKGINLLRRRFNLM